jgi:hypothetical protein
MDKIIKINVFLYFLIIQIVYFFQNLSTPNTKEYKKIDWFYI